MKGLAFRADAFAPFLADEAERERTRLALAMCSTSTVVTFSCLALSSTPVLRAIGATVAIGAVFSLLLAALWARAGNSAVE